MPVVMRQRKRFRACFRSGRGQTRLLAIRKSHTLPRKRNRGADRGQETAVIVQHEFDAGWISAH